MVNKISTLYVDNDTQSNRTLSDVFGVNPHGPKVPHGMPEPQQPNKQDLLSECDNNIEYLQRKLELTQKQLNEWINRRKELE